MAKTTRVPVLPLLAAVCTLTACVMPDQIARLQKDQADVQQQIREMRKAELQTQEKVAALDSKLQGGEAVKRSEFADLKVRFDELARQMTALDEKLRETNRRIDRLSQDVQATRELTRRLGAVPSLALAQPAGPGAAVPVPGAALSPGQDPVPSPDALYNSSYADFSKGNYSLAISGFQEYASRFPDSDLADNALYWIAECQFSQGKFAEALQAFDRMLDRHPQSDRAAAANLKKGLAYLEQNQVAQAIVQLRYVTGTYGGSDEARIARDKLASLGAASAD